MAIVVLEHASWTGAMRLGTTLRDHGHRLRVVALHEGDPVPDGLDDVDGVVAAGGPQDPAGQEPWMEPEMELLRVAHERMLPVVGICLGNQLLARALGGDVGELEGGPEIGWHDVTLTDAGREDVLHAGIAWTSSQPHWHRHHVTVAPPGARVLAGSRRTPIQAWAAGLRTYGFQYHPEVERDTLAVWSREHPDDLAAAGTDAQTIEAETAERFAVFERLSNRLFHAIALCLMPADRRIAGLVKDLHH